MEQTKETAGKTKEEILLESKSLSIPELVVPAYAVGHKTLIMGSPGQAKTSSIPTALLAGHRVFVLFTEPGLGALLKACRLHKVPEDVIANRLHWNYVPPNQGSFADLKQQAKVVNETDEYGKMEAGSKKKYDQLVQVMGVCANFVDQNGISWGAVDDWDASRFLAIDGLSGLSYMTMKLVIGKKATASLQDWGVAQNQLEDFIMQFSNCLCCIAMIAHVELERDEVIGKTMVYPATLGRKLGPKLGRHFNDVVYARFDGRRASWATLDKQADLKASYLAHDTDLPADFGPLVKAWKKEMSVQG